MGCIDRLSLDDDDIAWQTISALFFSNFSLGLSHSPSLLGYLGICSDAGPPVFSGLGSHVRA